MKIKRTENAVFSVFFIINFAEDARQAEKHFLPRKPPPLDKSDFYAIIKRYYEE